MAPSGALVLPRDIQPIRAIFAERCALAASGKGTSKQPSKLNSRRLMMVVLFYGQRGPNPVGAGEQPETRRKRQCAACFLPVGRHRHRGATNSYGRGYPAAV